MPLLLGLDVGSSSVKAALVEADSGTVLAHAVSPEHELPITAPKPGWAEQDPEIWWEHVKRAVRLLARDSGADLTRVRAVGISYQMHGLVIVDDTHAVIRPAIIWCDSRAVSIGKKAFGEIGPSVCFSHILNSPGNFTASKLAWVREHEPDAFGRISKFMLPGDYIAHRLTGEITTTPSGLSEGMLWDFSKGAVADLVLEHYEIPPDLLPRALPTFSIQGVVTRNASDELGIPTDVVVSYRAGDQPNNAFSLGVCEPGEVAATAGTSGVVYGVGDRIVFDEASRVNTFVHVTHTKESPRYGVLLCVNGAGILNSWLKHNIMSIDDLAFDYPEMNSRAAQAPVGSEGLFVFPFGNGAERTLGDRNPGAMIHGLNFTVHDRRHLLRASQEGIVFALKYGVDIMRDIGLAIHIVRAGRANMFLSPLFREAFVNTVNAHLEIYNTDGAVGAARGAGVGAGIYPDVADAFAGLKTEMVLEPDDILASSYTACYERWREELENRLATLD
ncbi:MAG: carbohydrate kinase [Deltaproteobacteria bacterium]|nr:carbohydrate kinase [Candidatus Zymogenaceae bacterium]